MSQKTQAFLLPKPGGGRLQAGSKLLSGDGILATGGQATCPVLGTHRTLGFPAGFRSVGSPAGDSGYLWQGPEPLPSSS